jgi:hypothetical protein
VYFTGSQGADYTEPPSYVAPTDYAAQNFCLRRPVTLRLITDTYSSGGPTSGTDTILHFISRIPDTQPNVDIGPFCSCTDEVEIPELGISVPPEDITVEFMNEHYEPLTGDPNTFESVVPETGADCSCDGGGGGGDVNQSYRTAASTATLPDVATRLIVSDMNPASWLSAASVADANVPGSATDFQFIGGKVLTIFLFGSDNAAGTYNAATIAASALGLRIAAASPIYRLHQIILAVNDSGGVSSGLKTKLQGIAAAFPDSNVSYVVYTSADQMAAAIDTFFQ